MKTFAAISFLFVLMIGGAYATQEPVHCWSLDSADTNADVTEDSASDNDLALFNNVTIDQTCKVGKCFLLVLLPKTKL